LRARAVSSAISAQLARRSSSASIAIAAGAAVVRGCATGRRRAHAFVRDRVAHLDVDGRLRAVVGG
jgi:hypothetical protein